MELKNSVDYSNYISINELIKILDKKYGLFENNKNFETERDEILRTSVKRKIMRTIRKQKNSIDYVQRYDSKKQYLISYQSISTLTHLLENYFIKRSITMNDQALKKRDDAIQSRQILDISKDKENRSLTLVEVQSKIQLMDFNYLNNEVANAVNKVAYNLIPRVTQTDLQKYKQINSDFEKQLLQDLQQTKSEIIFQNGLQHRYTKFDQAGYIKDYCLRELHTVRIQGKRIICRGYSKYDLKLQNPLYWYCG
ncbi:hypothetical protein [Lactobacillus crispatus]|uniref:hypothetical protein n=1 Tax=Lactobacillus crispatus TaxID=47770 RepID=UPI00103F32D7|nr:hypothetical protein [Lactobacillus crispatus]